MRLRALLGIFALLVALATGSTATAQQAPPGIVLDDGHLQRPFLRLRVGVDATGGGSVRGPQVGLGGARARFGVQVGDWFALYYMPAGVVGAIDRSRSGDWTAGFLYNTVAAEVTFLERVQLAVGPSMDFAWGCGTTPQDGGSCTDHGPFFGIDGRVAIVFEPSVFGGPTGVTLSGDVHPTWYANAELGVTILGGVGVEMY